MKCSLWDFSQVLPQVEEILDQIHQVKKQGDIIPYLKNDKHVDREEESFYDPNFTIITPSNNLHIRVFMSPFGYTFRIRSPAYKKFGNKLWLGPKINLYVVRLHKIHLTLQYMYVYNDSIIYINQVHNLDLLIFNRVRCDN